MPGIPKRPWTLLLSALVAMQVSAFTALAQPGGTWSVLPKSQVPVQTTPMYSNLSNFVSDSSGTIHMTDGIRLLRNAEGATLEIPLSLKANHKVFDMVADPAGPLWVLTATPLPARANDPDPEFALMRLAEDRWDTIPISPCSMGNSLDLLGEDGKGHVIVHSVHSTRSLMGPTSSRVLRVNGNECKEIAFPETDGPLLVSKGYTRTRQGVEYLFGNQIGGDIIYGPFTFRVDAEPKLLDSGDGETRIISLHAMKEQVLAILALGIGTLRGDRIQEIVKGVKGEALGEVSCIFQDSRGDIWIPTDYWDGTARRIRVLQIHGKDTVSHTVPSGPNETARAAVEDDRGNIWFMLSSGDLLLWTLGGNQQPLALSPTRPTRIDKARIGPGLAATRDALGRSFSRFLSDRVPLFSIAPPAP